MQMCLPASVPQAWQQHVPAPRGDGVADGDVIGSLQTPPPAADNDVVAYVRISTGWLIWLP